MHDIVRQYIDHPEMTKEEYILLLQQEEDPEAREAIRREALRLCRKYYGNRVYIRGLIEFTNYCKINCYYCGIRRDNRNVNRYRLHADEILSCCREGYALGYRTFVLQGGEDPYYTDERMCALIRQIKAQHPDCAITLSIGEKEKETYQKFREAGADRYLLRHETADETHYRSLHPPEMLLSHRKQCLYDLKELGYQVGAGCMVGSPGQTLANLADDLRFMADLQPEMVGIGPFIPHHDTCFRAEKAGSVERTLYLLSIIRILLPKVLLPATTALGTADEDGHVKGFNAGANVVMPNLTPLSVRSKYLLYDNKKITGDEDAANLGRLREHCRAAGYELSMERGDFIP